MHTLPHISVCVCTYKRPALLRRLLESLEKQETGGKFTFSVVIADNDATGSGREVAEAPRSYKVVYCIEPRKNIALVRNLTLQHAQGDFVAFIDDDEFPVADWLQKLLAVCEQYHSDAVLGPVRPHFETPPPSWIITGRLCERPEHPTGRKMPWDECRTGNVLFRTKILSHLGQPSEAFDAHFPNGGEDKDFFMRLSHKGCFFIWCNEAIAYETVPPSRCTRGYMLKRALLRGKNILKHPVGRGQLLVKSIIAVPLYCLALPALFLMGQDWFMRYSIKLCDHLGRLLALCGINPVSSRDH